MKMFLFTLASIFSGSLLAEDRSVVEVKTNRTIIRWSPPRASIPNPAYSPAEIHLVSPPRVDLALSTFIADDGTVASRDYKPVNPLLVPLIENSTQHYQVIEGGLKPGALFYSDRKYNITKIPDALRGLTLLQTRNSDKGIVDSRFSIVLQNHKPMYLFVAFLDQTLDQYENTGLPSWLEGFEATNYVIETDIPLPNDGYKVFVKYFASGRAALGACASDPRFSGMYFAFAAKAE